MHFRNVIIVRDFLEDWNAPRGRAELGRRAVRARRELFCKLGYRPYAVQ